jgi:hypothetical protein
LALWLIKLTRLKRANPLQYHLVKKRGYNNFEVQLSLKIGEL